MDPESPVDVIHDSDERLVDIERLIRRTSYIEGQVDMLDSMVARIDTDLTEHARETLETSIENLRAETDILRATAQDFLYTEADIRALTSMTAVFTSDLAEIEELMPGQVGSLHSTFAEYVSTFEDICEMIESEIDLLELVVTIDSESLEPAPADDIEPTESVEAMLTGIEEIQSKRRAKLEEIEAGGLLADFELTGLGFFDT